MTTPPPTFQHTKGLLAYLYSTYSFSAAHQARTGKSAGASSSLSSPPSSTHPLPTSQLELSVRKLALTQSRAHSQATNSASSNSNDSNASVTDESETDEDDDERMRSSELTMVSSSDVSDHGNGNEKVAEEDKMKNVLRLLGDEDVDDDDKPEELKELLRSQLVTPSDAPLNLDPIILSLLHRYREDTNPSGNPVPPLPNHGSSTPSSRPSVSRSSSFRRNLGPPRPNAGPTSTNTNSTALSSSVSSTSSRSAPTSPFRAASPSLVGSSARHTPAHSPWSSPRPTPISLALSAAAPEFKFSAGASEFKPGAASSSPIIGSSPSLLPGTPGRAQQAQANWAFANSPLGTPKFGGAPQSSNGGNSNVGSPNYFPRILPTPEHISSIKTGRLPWQEAEDEDDENPEEPKSYEAGTNENHSVAYSAGPMWDQTSEGERRYAADSNHWSDPQYQQGRPRHPGWDFIEGEGYADSSSQPQTPTYEDADMLIPGSAPGEMPSIEFANGLTGAAGLGGMGAYQMTPFDHLYSIFASSGISDEALEDVLTQAGYDVDRAIELIIENPSLIEGIQGKAEEGSTSQLPLPPGFELPGRATSVASGSRPVVMSRDSFDAYMSRGVGAASRWPPGPGSRPETPDAGRAVGGRVCRYYLAGNCLRSDCKFSHDVGKAVCKFWLRGHCLKGDGRCDFLHSIPPIMQADFAARARQREQGGFVDPEQQPRDEGPDLDFPTLGEMNQPRRNVAGRATTVVLDPARTRFSGAVKFGPKFAPVPIGQRSMASAVSNPLPSRDNMSRPKPSARVPLRPPALLPKLPTGPQLAALYVRYRSSFLELGAKRNKCLARAAECFKRGDGAGARKFSREAQEWSRQVLIEGKDSAARIVAERKRLLKEAILEGGTRGSTDDAPDRKVRGREMSGTICLGVVSQASVPRSNSGGEIRNLTADERTEVALDLHALHTDEAISFMSESLTQLERQRFQGIAYFVIGQSRHSGSSAPDRTEAAGRLRLEQACSDFLSDQGWPWQIYSGVLAVDALR